VSRLHLKITVPDSGSKAGHWGMTSHSQVPATKTNGPKSHHTKKTLKKPFRTKKNPNKTFRTKKNPKKTLDPQEKT
jgi:hypothetical protein